MSKAEQAILDIFQHFNTPRGQMVMIASFLNLLDDYGINAAEFQQGMSSLIAKGMVEERKPGMFFLV